MTNDPKLLSIIILAINLIVLGPVSWIIKDLKTAQRDQYQTTSTRLNNVEKRLDSLKESTYTEYATSTDLQLVVKRLSTLEGRIYDLTRSAGNAANQ